MSSRYYSDPEIIDATAAAAMTTAKKPGMCGNFLRYTWKTITCLFSHITLVSMVVSYCILGAVTFQSLEQGNEKEVKRNIRKIRGNITDELWKLTYNAGVLKEENFTSDVAACLKDFETALLKAMTKDGWDGDENEANVQWSLPGALFYSIIVITTIGYGHIAPKTTWGKVVTIFYAILGIPLMLLCLSNIGDIMATSFRFLYWKVCCYVCTKKPKKHRRGRSQRSTLRTQPSMRNSVRSRAQSIKQRPNVAARTSQRSGDSGFGYSFTASSHSDTELRYQDEMVDVKRGRSMPRIQPPQQHQQPGTSSSSQRSRFSDTSERRKSSPRPRGGSLDRRRARELHPTTTTPPQRSHATAMIDPSEFSNAPVYCNRYVVDQNEIMGNHVPVCADDNSRDASVRFKQTKKHSEQSPVLFEGITYNERNNRQASPGRRAVSLPRAQQPPQQQQQHNNYLEPPRDSSPIDEPNSDPKQSQQQQRKTKKQQYSPSPRIMSPLGYGHKNKYLDEPPSDDEYYLDDAGSTSYEPNRSRVKPVPIWLCVFLVVSYIFAGTLLFSYWEGWDYLDAAYFCFITLTTIGFGDFVPATRVQSNDFKKNIAYCSLYLLFGIALLAMSFNLVQEEVIANVKRVAKSLGIIKTEEEEDDEDD